YATPAQRESIALARWAGQGFAMAEQLAAFGGIVPAKIHRFPNFRERIVQGLATLALQQRDEMRCSLLKQIGEPFQDLRAALGRCSAPIEERAARRSDRQACMFRRCVDDVSDNCGLINRTDDRPAGLCL